MPVDSSERKYTVMGVIDPKRDSSEILYSGFNRKEIKPGAYADDVFWHESDFWLCL